MNNPIGFYFALSFEGQDAAFQEVLGISKEIGIEEVVSGGENRFKYKLPTVTTSTNLILKRGMIPYGSKLLQWCVTCIDSNFSTPITTKDIRVNLLDNNGEVLVKWMFYKAYPVKYAVSDLHSQKNEILIESIELAYTHFEISQS